MVYLHNLRVRLQERRNRLYRTGYQTYDAELRYLLEFLDNNPLTRSLLTEIKESPSESQCSLPPWILNIGSLNTPIIGQ